MIFGLFETHIDVADLERPCRSYGETLGLELGLVDEERRVDFFDPDGPALEFIAMLPDEPRPEVNVVSWEEWQRLNGREPEIMPSPQLAEAGAASQAD